jgi:uncharacterized membrane protein YozB (DUF420 family)
MDTLTVSNHRVQRSGSLVWIGLIVIFGGSAYFVVKDALPYFDFSPASYGPFWANRDWLLPHLCGGLGALVFGGAQLCLGFSRRTGRWHRYLGRGYVAAVLLSAVASLGLIARGSVVGPVFGALLAPVAGIWVVFTLMAWVAIRRHQWPAHRDWMIRSYAVALGFVLFRLGTELPVLTTWKFADRYSALIGITFLLILAGTEIMLQWRGSMGSARAV